jgi:hypothetical protein
MRRASFDCYDGEIHRFLPSRPRRVRTRQARQVRINGEKNKSMDNPVVHFEIIGENMQLLSSYYGSVFDWKIDPVMDEYSLVTTGSGIAGGIGAIGQARRHVSFYVEVADVEAALTTIESKGGQKALGPHPVPTGAIVAGFTDPAGNLVGLVKQPNAT